MTVTYKLQRVLNAAARSTGATKQCRSDLQVQSLTVFCFVGLLLTVT